MTTSEKEQAIETQRTTWESRTEMSVQTSILITCDVQGRYIYVTDPTKAWVHPPKRKMIVPYQNEVRQKRFMCFSMSGQRRHGSATAAVQNLGTQTLIFAREYGSVAEKATRFARASWGQEGLKAHGPLQECVLCCTLTTICIVTERAVILEMGKLGEFRNLAWKKKKPNQRKLWISVSGTDKKTAAVHDEVQ